MKKLIINLICKRFNFDKSNIYMLRSNHKDSKDIAFKELFNQREFQDNSLLDYSRAYFIYQWLQNLENISGSIAECGSYQGGTAYLIAKSINHNTNIHIFDTFEGMPNLISEHDSHKAGDLADTSFEKVKELLTPFSNLQIHQGLFSDCFKGINKDEEFKLVHCDADIYESVMDTHEFFYPKLVKGGVIIYDDYGWATTKGAQKAVLDFYKDKPEYPVYLPTRQAFIVKQ